MLLKIGITGQAGFVGTHLYNTLGLYPDKFERIPFADDFFQDNTKLIDFVKNCDVIVHLAAMNRHNDPNVIYETNIKLVKQVIDACEVSEATPHILFSSSTQEEKDNLYGRSKLEGRKLLELWALRNKASFTGLVIPNVFGPFGNPYYNSVVATFCHQLTHNETPRIEVDSEIKLIYVGQLVQRIIESIEKKDTGISEIKVPHTAEITVSGILELLKKYKEDYFGRGEIPDLSNTFKRNLFLTFLGYIDIPSFYPYKLQINTDNRGNFIETVKLNSGGQVSFSTTVPGITRGNHFHLRKVERFAVIKGKARIEIRRIGTDKVYSFDVDGLEPAFVDMPVWYTHNITNIGTEELFTVFWINEHYDVRDSDTFYEKV